MTRARYRGLPVLRALVLFGVGGVWAVACGGPQPLGGAGSVCFRADECQAGLACVPETMGATKHVCSADLSGIVSMVDGAPVEGGDMPEETGGSPAMPQGGSTAEGGTPSAAGTAGKAAGGAPGAGGKAGTAGATAMGGSSAGGSSSGGSSLGGTPAAGGAAGGSNAGGSSNGGAEISGSGG